jgi:hypothetical protein
VGQDGEDRPDDGGLTPVDPSPAAAGSPPRPDFEDELRSAVRYERGLLVKALVALAIVVLIIVVHQLATR